MGLFGNVGGFLGQLGGMGDAFAQAGAMMSGDWGDAANIAQNRSQLQGLRAKQQAEAEQQQRVMAALKAQGLTEEQALLVASNAGSIGDFRQKKEAAPVWEDNAGNRWTMGEDGQAKPLWVDPNDKQSMVTGADGSVRFAPQPNALRGSQFDRPVGKITPIPDPVMNGGAGQAAPRTFRYR